VNQIELAQPSRRRRVHRVASEPERVTAHVTVAWTPSNHDGAPRFSSTEIELVPGFEASPHQSWIEAISSARCREVLLTARLGNNVPAKHLVLELAELLTFSLTEIQPLIRVRFLPTAGADPSHA